MLPVISVCFTKDLLKHKKILKETIINFYDKIDLPAKGKLLPVDLATKPNFHQRRNKLDLL